MVWIECTRRLRFSSYTGTHCRLFIIVTYSVICYIWNVSETIMTHQHPRPPPNILIPMGRNITKPLIAYVWCLRCVSVEASTLCFGCKNAPLYSIQFHFFMAARRIRSKVYLSPNRRIYWCVWVCVVYVRETWHMVKSKCLRICLCENFICTDLIGPKLFGVSLFPSIKWILPGTRLQNNGINTPRRCSATNTVWKCALFVKDTRGPCMVSHTEKKPCDMVSYSP